MDKIQDLISRVEALEDRRIYKRDIVPNEIKQSLIDGIIIFRGIVADLPSDGSTEIQAFWAEDESKLYLWNTINDAWEGVTLA